MSALTLQRPFFISKNRGCKRCLIHSTIQVENSPLMVTCRQTTGRQQPEILMRTEIAVILGTDLDIGLIGLKKKVQVFLF